MNLVIGDPRHGRVEISVDREHGVVDVNSSSLPNATVMRRQGSMAGDPSPIGTRDPKQLVLTVGSDSGQVSPGTGFATRRSYRIRVEYRDASYELTPRSANVSRFSRNGVELATFDRAPTGAMEVSWAPQASITPGEAALGYLLVGAYGVGSPGVLKSIVGHGGTPF
ncbi:hypothetical protein [Kitasatospora sp. MBT66]|uniref:hypothetical protein n=1 Tax=Kitasatospora sp. MBT66 TaxID=1444769 RepID=UPI00068F3932|nr:hypothetical protein [Kitasatospora sp. MBT66]